MASLSLPRAALVAACLAAVLAPVAGAQEVGLPVGFVALPDPFTEQRYQAGERPVPNGTWQQEPGTCAPECEAVTAGPDTDPAALPAWVRALPVYRAMAGDDGVVDKPTHFYPTNVAVTPDATSSDCLYGYVCLYEHLAFFGRLLQTGVSEDITFLGRYDFSLVASSIRNRAVERKLCVASSTPGGFSELAARTMAPSLGSMDNEPTAFVFDYQGRCD